MGRYMTTEYRDGKVKGLKVKGKNKGTGKYGYEGMREKQEK